MQQRFARYDALRDKCGCNSGNTSRTDPVQIESLARMVTACVGTLPPAEQVAREVVHDIFLLFLLHDSSDLSVVPIATPRQHQQQHQQHVKVQLAVVGALHSLLKDSKHASAIMAPLVNDVTADGAEDQVANPIRRGMFQALQQQLLQWTTTSDASNSSLDTRLTEQTCECLAKALKEAKRIDGTKHHAGIAETDVDATVLRQFLSHTLIMTGVVASTATTGTLATTTPQPAAATNSRLQRLALELLLSLLQRHPESASTLATLLLLTNDTTTTVPAALVGYRNCVCSRRCGYHSGTLPLLQLVHNGSTDPRESILAIECTAGLVHGLPLTLWLRDDRRVLQSPSTFRQQVSQSLVTVIGITRCSLVRADDRVMEALLHLARVILLEIPYSNDNKEDIQKSALDLVELIAIVLFVDSARSVKVRDSLNELLVECMGGRVTPQGHLTTMVAPVKSWLDSFRGKTFIKEMLTAARQEESLVVNNPTKVLRALLRTSPQAMLGDEASWNNFRQCIQTQVKSPIPGKQIAGLELVEAMLRGRKDFGADSSWHVDSSALVSYVAPILQTAIIRGNSSCKCVTVASYGSLLGCDWSALSGDEGGCLAHVCSILLLCDKASKSSAKVRSEACKAVGDICAHYLPTNFLPLQSKSEARLFCDRVGQVVTEMQADTAASVRSMALFAAGNLVQSLRADSIPIMLDMATLSRLVLKVRGCMDDPDDKVTANAIRSVAHATCLMLRGDYHLALKGTGVEPEVFLSDVLNALAERVRLSLLLARGGESQKSWKQRSAVKKHGWGAANSLATLFSDLGVVSEDMVKVYQKVVATLVECVEALSIVHEKVAISCMAALCSLKPRSFSRISGRQGLVGRTVIACLVHYVDRESRDTNKKVARELDLLLLHLLQSSSIADASLVLESERISACHLDFLYQWMAEKECSTHVFDCFAIAMLKPGVNVDVQLEQGFASRSVCQGQMDNLGEEL
jgi:hypothetical protein